MTAMKNEQVEYNEQVENMVDILQYVEIAGLKWARQNLAVTESGLGAWTDASGSPVMLPGTGVEAMVGDYFQWGAHEGCCAAGDGGDRGLLAYESFDDRFTFRKYPGGTECKFGCTHPADRLGVSPYYDRIHSRYLKYEPLCRTTLETIDDAASIILGGGWRMPTTDEFRAMYDATSWTWLGQDRGCYVTWRGEELNEDRSNALLFFPATGYGFNSGLYSSGTIGSYWSSSLCLESPTNSFFLYSGRGMVNPQSAGRRFVGRPVRPVHD